MAFSGWFPHFSPSGANLVTGTGTLWINKTQQVGFGYQGVPSATRAWFNETTILFMGATPAGAAEIWSCTVGGTRRSLGIAGEFYQLVVASGRWAGWYGAGIRTSWGQTVTADSPRAPILSNGHFGYLLDGNTANQRLVVDGVTIDTAPIIDPMMSAQGVCWVRWTAGVREIWGMRLDIADSPADVGASDATEYQAIPIDTPSGPWILSYDSKRLLLRPWGDTDGYVVATGETMYPMASWHASTGTFRVGWSSSAGVYKEAFVDPASARVALGGTSDPVTPGETLPGAPGAVSSAIAILPPPLRHPMLEEGTGLVTKPWATWFEQQAQLAAVNPYAYVPANSIIGRGASGPGPATTLTLGTGLTIRDGTLIAE